MNKLSTRQSLRLYQAIGLAGLILVVGSLGGWAAIASIQGAVIASGVIVVESHVKRVEHREGGIVTEIHVDEGDKVEEGDLLIRLDDTERRGELAVIDSALAEYEAKRARLIAERDQQPEVQFPESLLARRDDRKIAEIMAGQISLFKARNGALQGRKEQLRQRISQLEQEIEGLKAQIGAKRIQIELAAGELEVLRGLFEQGLVQKPRITALEREQSRLEGDIGQLTAQVARAKSRIGETKLHMIQLEDDLLTETLGELSDAESRIAELEEQQLMARSKLLRTSIRAPWEGYVHQLNAHTIGGVIKPGEIIMLIVPNLDDLLVEAQVRPEDIDNVIVGQPAMLHFSAYSARTTPRLMAEVVHVSADLTRPADGSPPYYLARLRVNEDQTEQMEDINLKPGMPAESFIQTEARTPMNYILKPLMDQVARTFREG